MPLTSCQRHIVWHLSPSGNTLTTDECQPREDRAFTCYPGAQLGFCALIGKDGSMQEQGMARRGGAAFIWTWGAICGVVLGVIQIIISLLPLGSLKTILDVLVWLIGFFVLGLFAPRRLPAPTLCRGHATRSRRARRAVLAGQRKRRHSNTPGRHRAGRQPLRSGWRRRGGSRRPHPADEPRRPCRRGVPL